MKFLVTLAIFADLNTKFLQAIPIESIFAKIAINICNKVLLQFAILVLLYLPFFLYTSDSSFDFFCQNCQNNLLPNFCDSIQ